MNGRESAGDTTRPDSLCDLLQQALGELSEMITSTEDRLSQVLEPCEAARTPEEAPCPTAVADGVRRVLVQTARLKAIRDRIVV